MLSTYIYEGDYIYVEPGGNLCPNDTGFYHFTFEGPELSEEFISFCNPEDPSTWYLEVEILGGEPPFITESGIILDDTFYSEPLDFVSWEVEISDASGCSIGYWWAWPPNSEDGLCDPIDIEGCMQPNSPNYYPFANVPAPCELGDSVEMVYELTELDVEDPWGSGVTVGSDDTIDWDFTLYPNPRQNSEQLQIELIGIEAEGNYTLHCYDMTGRLVFTELLQAQKGLNQISDLNGYELKNGTYHIILTDKRGIRKEQTLLVRN
jgi:hypothetical protein